MKWSRTKKQKRKDSKTWKIEETAFHRPATRKFKKRIKRTIKRREKQLFKQKLKIYKEGEYPLLPMDGYKSLKYPIPRDKNELQVAHEDCDLSPFEFAGQKTFEQIIKESWYSTATELAYGYPKFKYLRRALLNRELLE